MKTYKVIAIWENDDGTLEDENGILYMRNPNDRRISRCIKIGKVENVGVQTNLNAFKKCSQGEEAYNEKM